MSSFPSLRPVTRTFPASQEVLDDSNLPFAVTITPLHYEDDDEDDGDDDNHVAVQQQQQQQDSATQTDSQETRTSPPPPPRSSNRHRRPLSSLHGIPKCLRCGAPHACRTTHFRPPHISTPPTNGSHGGGGPFLLCYLCGRTSSTAAHEQTAARAAVEGIVVPDNTATTTSSGSSNNKAKTSPTAIFSLPLRLMPSHHGPTSASSAAATATTATAQCYEIDATECPPLWWVVLDGSCAAPAYWAAVSETLQLCLRRAPPHVHVALLIASSNSGSGSGGGSGTTADHMSHSNPHAAAAADSNGNNDHTLGIFDLQSAVPHVRHWNAACSRETDLLRAVLQAAVPADTPHIATAVRSLLDYHYNISSNNRGQTTARCPVAWTTEVVLAALQTGALPAGQRFVSTTAATTMRPSGNGSNNLFETEQRLPYAGGKLLFVLANRPAGISETSQHSHSPTGRRTAGGWGGQISGTVGERFGGEQEDCDANYNHNPTDPLLGPYTPASSTSKRSGKQASSSSRRHRHRSDPHETELTPQRLVERYQPVPGIEEYYAELGRQCADAAIGVDLLMLVSDSSPSSSPSRGEEEEHSLPDFGVALFQSLGIRSGAHGPLLFDLAEPAGAASSEEVEPATKSSKNGHNSHHSKHPKPDTPLARFQREVLSRTPWQEDRVFGAELRLRLSPGFSVDPTTIVPHAAIRAPQLAPLFYEAGLVGPAAAVGESTQLWRMGVADPFTAFTVDLAVQNKGAVRDRYPVEGFGEVALRPVIQTCFAYTTVVRDAETSAYKTVRRMRIASRPVPLAHSVEALYATLDTESLAVVLFHKLALAAFQDGLGEAAELAHQWLKLFLACVYRSAEEQLNVQRELEAKGVALNDKIARYFYPGERLLDLEGDLSAEDVLLAQGHERLRPVALMVYLLLQCDPLRLSHGSYRPSFDLRCAAISQMTSMPPGTLTRCIAPRLQLWESGRKVQEPILDVLDLRSEAIQTAVLEHGSNSGSGSSKALILLLDTPEQIVLMDARWVNTDFSGNNAGSENSAASPQQNHKRGGASASRPLVVGEGLRQAVEDAANSYRTRPRIIYELDQSATSGEQTFLRLLDCLIEDTPNTATGAESFGEWKARVAREVQKDID